MPAIKQSEAIEKLALAAESASSADDLVEIYAELFPGRWLPDVAGAKSILTHADTLPTTSDAERLLRSDLFRSAWMFAEPLSPVYVQDSSRIAISHRDRVPDGGVRGVHEFNLRQREARVGNSA